VVNTPGYIKWYFNDVNQPVFEHQFSSAANSALTGTQCGLSMPDFTQYGSSSFRFDDFIVYQAA
jgi:hypothetical protein